MKELISDSCRMRVNSRLVSYEGVNSRLVSCERVSRLMSCERVSRLVSYERVNSRLVSYERVNSRLVSRRKWSLNSMNTWWYNTIFDLTTVLVFEVPSRFTVKLPTVLLSFLFGNHRKVWNKTLTESFKKCSHSVKNLFLRNQKNVILDHFYIMLPIQRLPVGPWIRR